MNVIRANIDNQFNIVPLYLLKGGLLNLRITNIPTSSVTPFSYIWQLRKEPLFANGTQNWSGGVAITNGSGTLATVNTDSLDVSISLVSNDISIGDYLSFVFGVGISGSEKTVVAVVYKIDSINIT